MQYSAYIVKQWGNLNLQNFMTCDLSLYYAPLPLLKYGHPTLFEVLYLHYSTSPICYIEVNVNNDNLTCPAHFGCFLTWEGSINWQLVMRISDFYSLIVLTVKLWSVPAAFYNWPMSNTTLIETITYYDELWPSTLVFTLVDVWSFVARDVVPVNCLTVLFSANLSTMTNFSLSFHWYL